MASLRKAAALCAASGIVALAIWQGCAVYDSSLLLDSGADASDAFAPDVQVDAGDGCNHKLFPPRPLADDDASVDDIQLYMALESLDFGTGDGGGAPVRDLGYDLDGVCTCPGVDSCMPAAEAGSQCDLEGGVDDSTGKLLALYSGPTNFWDQSYINQHIAAGQFGAFLRIQNWNGQANDRQVELALFISNGTKGVEIDGGPSTPQFDGNDIWTLDPNSLLGGVIDPDAGPTPVVAYDLNAYVSNYSVVANISDMPLAIGASTGEGLVTIELTGAHVIANLTPFGSSGQFQASGTVAGRWQTNKLLTSLQVLIDPFQPDAALCNGDPIYAILKGQICAHQDITTSPSDDNTGAPCNALSLAFDFTAVPAKYGAVFAKPDAGGGCGPTYTDSCGP